MKTGNVKNVAAFEKLVGICNDLGPNYNPSKAALTPTAIATLLEQAQQSLEAVNVARVDFVLAVNNRLDGYATIYPLAQRVVRALAASGCSYQHLEDARALRRKMTSKTLVSESTSHSEAASVPAVTHSSSRQDFEGMVETFASLVQLVKSIPEYAPNEADLTVNALKAVQADLRNKAKEVAHTSNALANARIHRNKVLNGENGVYATATAVKEYIRSVFGVRSEASRELGKLRIAA
jgi:hypothetical protein